jgi:hypothetical protein
VKKITIAAMLIDKKLFLVTELSSSVGQMQVE